VEKNIRNVAENEACAKQKIKKNISQTKAAPLSVKQLLAVSVSAGFLSLAFSRFNLGVLAWGGLVPFFITINGKKLRARLWSSFVFGFLFFLGTIYWVGHVSFVGLIVLCLYLSLYFCLFAVMAKNFALRSSLIFVPAIWVGAEFLRSHLLTGFGWSLIGYTQYKNLWLIQIAAFVGVGGVSFLLVMVNVALTQLISKKPKICW